MSDAIEPAPGGEARSCPCGSGEPRHARYDARAIFLCFTCNSCHARRMRGFRADVLTDPSYPADEPVEEE